MKNEKENDKLNKKLGFKNNVFGGTTPYDEPSPMAMVNFCEIHSYGDFHEDGSCHGSHFGEIRANLKEVEGQDHPLIRVKRSAVKLGDVYDNLPAKAESVPHRVGIKRTMADHLEHLIRYGDESGVPVEDALEYLLARLKDPEASQKFYDYTFANHLNIPEDGKTNN